MKEKKNLLVQIDGMGDCFIRLGLLNLMEQKYGKDKIVLLTGRGQGIDMFRYLGYECIDYNQDYLSLIETKKLYKELNKYNFGDLHLMNFYKSSNDSRQAANEFNAKDVPHNTIQSDINSNIPILKKQQSL